MVAITKTAPVKGFSWSPSKLKNFEDCPRRHKEVDIDKNYPAQERSEHLVWGDAVHLALANRLRDGTPLPEDMDYEPWVERVLRTPGTMFIEDDAKLAITRDYKKCPWFSPNTWARCVADVLKVDEPVALVVDWKTGKSANQDASQLILLSLMTFCHFPLVQKVRADFIFLQDGAQTSVVMDRKEAPDHWAELLPRIEELQTAIATSNFPPTPGRFCRSWCPVRWCEYWGK
jgi:PD-(D/E)XK nuclease superfamily